jgi:anti-anti-sigma regulatory factor
MANNFHMFKHKTNESLHIKLTGDFDGSSASGLINALVDNQNRYYQIFINATEIKNIDPFGLDVLQNRLSEIRDQGPGVIFIGKNIGQSLN